MGKRKTAGVSRGRSNNRAPTTDRDLSPLPNPVPKRAKRAPHNPKPHEEVLHTCQTFYVGAMNWTRDTRTGGMYVEVLRPAIIKQINVVILLHGDNHTAGHWRSKPNGEPGWATYFLKKGFEVYIVDLPSIGRSKHPTSNNHRHLVDGKTPRMPMTMIEQQLTGHKPVRLGDEVTYRYEFPGFDGKVGEPAFNAYYDSLVPVELPRVERQEMGRQSMVELLQTIDKPKKAFLIGHGTRATIAWLAADTEPSMVAGVFALEPVGPPFGDLGKTGIERCLHRRQYGLADIPLTFEPAPNDSFNHPELKPLDVVEVFDRDNGARYFMQDGPQNQGQKIGDVHGTTRKLVNLAKMRHVIVTGAASKHQLFDWATVRFMSQAGVEVFHLKLDNRGIFGNGNLFFLEKNSDEIATEVFEIMEMMTEHSERERAEEAEAKAAARAAELAATVAADNAAAGINPARTATVAANFRLATRNTRANSNAGVGNGVHNAVANNVAVTTNTVTSNATPTTTVAEHGAASNGANSNSAAAAIVPENSADAIVREYHRAMARMTPAHQVADDAPISPDCIRVRTSASPPPMIGNRAEPPTTRSKTRASSASDAGSAEHAIASILRKRPKTPVSLAQRAQSVVGTADTGATTENPDEPEEKRRVSWGEEINRRFGRGDATLPQTNRFDN